MWSFGATCFAIVFLIIASLVALAGAYTHVAVTVFLVVGVYVLARGVHPTIRDLRHWFFRLGLNQYVPGTPVPRDLDQNEESRLPDLTEIPLLLLPGKPHWYSLVYILSEVNRRDILRFERAHLFINALVYSILSKPCSLVICATLCRISPKSSEFIRARFLSMLVYNPFNYVTTTLVYYSDMPFLRWRKDISVASTGSYISRLNHCF